jgi:hypothetical protein
MNRTWLRKWKNLYHDWSSPSETLFRKEDVDGKLIFVIPESRRWTIPFSKNEPSKSVANFLALWKK